MPYYAVCMPGSLVLPTAPAYQGVLTVQVWAVTQQEDATPLMQQAYLSLCLGSLFL